MIASASNGVPSWKVTPGRAVRVHVVKSALGSIESNRNGRGRSSSPRYVIGS